MDLTPPRSVHGPIYPWDKHYRGPLANYDGDPSKEKVEDIIVNGVKVQVEAKKEDKAAPQPDKKVCYCCFNIEQERRVYDVNFVNMILNSKLKAWMNSKLGMCVHLSKRLKPLF